MPISNLTAQGTPLSGPRLDWLGLGLGLAAGALALGWFSPFVTDDALITLRYSRHLIEGYGLVWNPGEAPVEGYSNFLHVLLGAGAIALDAPPLVCLRWLNRFASLALVFATWLYALRVCHKPVFAGIAAVLVGVHVPLAFWASSGLETALFCLSVVLGCYFALLCEGRRRWWAALAFGVASLTRAEGPVFPLTIAIVTAGEALWRERRLVPALRSFLSAHAGWLLLFGIPYVGYFAWTWAYFGYPVPNSVYFKSVSKAPGKLDLDFLSWNLPLLVLALAAPYRRSGSRLAALLVLVGVHLAMLYNVKSTGISYLHRLFLPVFPGVVVLAVAGLERLVGERLSRGRIAFASLATVGLVGWYLLHPELGAASASERVPRLNYRILQRLHVADWLGRHLDPDARVLVSDVGVIGYVLPNPIDDAFGLNDLEYAHQFRRDRSAYVASLIHRNPAAIVVVSKHPERHVMRYVTDNSLRKLVLDHGYARGTRVLSKTEAYHYWVHLDRSSAQLRDPAAESLLPPPEASSTDADPEDLAALIESVRRNIAKREVAR